MQTTHPHKTSTEQYLQEYIRLGSIVANETVDSKKQELIKYVPKGEQWQALIKGMTIGKYVKRVNKLGGYNSQEMELTCNGKTLLLASFYERNASATRLVFDSHILCYEYEFYDIDNTECVPEWYKIKS